MPTRLSEKGQATLPDWIREALGLEPGMPVDFTLKPDGDVVIRPAEDMLTGRPDRFDEARGRADVKWRTSELMALLRGDADRSDRHTASVRCDDDPGAGWRVPFPMLRSVFDL